MFSNQNHNIIHKFIHHLHTIPRTNVGPENGEKQPHQLAFPTGADMYPCYTQHGTVQLYPYSICATNQSYDSFYVVGTRQPAEINGPQLYNNK